MRKPVKTFIFVLLFLCAQPMAKAIEEIVNPLLSWSHVQTVFSEGEDARVFYIFKKDRRPVDRKNSFLVCSYPRIYGLALESDHPNSNCFNEGEKFNLEELEAFLSETSRDYILSDCPEIELLYAKLSPDDIIEYILSDVTFIPKVNIFHCAASVPVTPIVGVDGSVSLVESQSRSYTSHSGDFLSVTFLEDGAPSLLIESSEGGYSQKQKLPCFPNEKIETNFAHNEGVYEVMDYGSEIDQGPIDSKKSIFSKLLKLGKSIPGFKVFSRNEIARQLKELGIEEDLRPSKEELKEMVDQIALASSPSQAAENIYVFGATLILQRLIKQQNLPNTGTNGDSQFLCERLDRDCHNILAKSIYSFKSCLSKHIFKKVGADYCVKNFQSKALGQIAFDVSEHLIDDYIGTEKAELLCADKTDSCDENFCSKENCVEQALVVLKQRAKKQIGQCFKSFDPKDNKGEPLLTDRLRACVTAGLISATDYLARVGGSKKIMSAAKAYLDKHDLGVQAKGLVDSFFAENGIKTCLISSLSTEDSKSTNSYNYQSLAELSEEKISEHLFSCVDKTSFDVTRELMNLVLPYEIGTSISSIVENEDSRKKIVRDVMESLVGENGEFQRCAKSEMGRAEEDREDDDGETNYEADPERCLVPLSFEAYSQTVIGLIGDQLGSLTTASGRINESLGEDFLSFNNGGAEGEWKENLIECQQEKKEAILASDLDGEDIENLIEKSTVECAILGIGDAAKIITLDELINHPKVKEYEITLGNRYEKKISEAVRSCIVEEFQKEQVETINKLGEVFPKAKDKCQSVAIHKTLHPDVTKSIIRDLLEENLGGTDYSDLVSEVAPILNILYECNYYRVPVTSPRYTQCISIYKKYGLDTSKFFITGIPEDKVLEFLEGDFKKSAYKIVISEVLKKKAFDTVSEKLGGELSDEEKREVSAAVRSSRAIDKGVDLFMEKNSMERIESELEGVVTKSLVPVVLKHMLLRKKYDDQVAKNAESNLTSCLAPIDPSNLNEVKTERGYLCKVVDICISREVLAIAKNEANQAVDSIINGLGHDDKWGVDLIKKYSKIKAKEYVDACIEKEITCKDYTTFPSYSLEMQQYTIFSCLLN